MSKQEILLHEQVETLMQHVHRLAEREETVPAGVYTALVAVEKQLEKIRTASAGENPGPGAAQFFNRLQANLE